MHKESTSSSSSTLHYKFIKQLITAIISIIIFHHIALTFNIVTRNNGANAEYFSSVDSLQKLKGIELNFIRHLEDFFNGREKEFKGYRRFIENVKMLQIKDVEYTKDNLDNPIYAFKLIKQAINFWNYIQQQTDKELQQLYSEFNKIEKIPNENEMKGAVKGLARLQRVYNLQARQLANGTINGINYGVSLTWHDCFELGLNLYNEKDFVMALSWLNVSLEKFLDNSSLGTRNPLQMNIQILEYLALTNYELGYNDEALIFINDLLKLAPQHEVKNFKHYLTKNPSKQNYVNITDTAEIWYHNYTRLCRGVQLPDENIKNLNCKLETRNNPHFLLAPLKVEELNKDFDINLYHNLLNDKQIEILLKAAEQKMFRSLIRAKYGDPNSTNIISDVRVSQNAWLNFDSPTTKVVHNLVADITGLDMRNAEIIQLANYGIAGQFEPHTDFFGPDCFQTGRYLGDRIVTAMFYLSDVEQGGYTVFPRMNLFSRPVKGALILWYNLHRSLDGDHRALHAGCPVVKGSKRIGNIWIHAQFQEFRRPCLLKSDTEKSAGYKPVTKN